MLMLIWLRRISILAMVSALALVVFTISTTYAFPNPVQNACSVTVSPSDVTPASENNFTLSVDNQGSESIQWINFLVPPNGLYYNGNSISDWSTADHAGGTTLTGNSLGAGQTENFSITASSDIFDSGSANWQVQASNDPSGASAYACSGNLSTSISGSLPNDTDTNLENVTVSAVTDSTATITWNTDSPVNSLVYYGQTSAYGSQSSTDQTLDTNHSLTLTGLSANTGYHYQVAGSDGQGNVAYSADDTLLTASTPLNNGGPPPVNTPTPPSTTQTSVIVGKGARADITPPKISVITRLAGSYKTAPTFSGVASDNKAIARVDYSTDDGADWLPVNVLTTADQSRVVFSFTPIITQDGNYTVLTKATDTTGNTTTTAPQILIINNSPPVVGGNIFSAGPQIIDPDSNGTIDTQEGVDLKITLSAIGGPTNISISATALNKTKPGLATDTQNFNLTASQDNGLWSGIVGFTHPGLYNLVVNATDGAGSKTSRALNDVYVVAPGHTINKNTGKPIASTVTVYYFNPESQTWVVWDGSAYNQVNPQATSNSGNFSMLLPPGTYYLQAKASGYRTVVGSIFTANKPTALSTNLSLSPLHGLHIGSYYLTLPSLSVQHVNLTNQTPRSFSQNSLLGKLAPDFSLSDTNGSTIQTADLLGRPTLISFDSTWSPTTAEQLSALSQLQTNPNFNIIPIALQDNSSLVQAYTAVADLKLNWLVDPDSTTSISYNVQSLPMNYFVDRNGVVKRVVIGVLNKQQIQSELSEL